jgi:hypothetical protein
VAEEDHPGGAVGLFQVAPSGERGAAVKDPDIVQAQEAPFEDIPAGPVLAVQPPGEIQQSLPKIYFKKSKSPLPS